jgi:uncharacterized protein YpbB
MMRLFNREFKETITDNLPVTKKQENFNKKTELSKCLFTVQKTLKLHKQGLNIPQISETRCLKESTIWSHVANLVEHRQISVWKILPRSKIIAILQIIKNHKKTLKEIKCYLSDSSITFDEIQCVVSSINSRKKGRNKS